MVSKSETDRQPFRLHHVRSRGTKAKGESTHAVSSFSDTYLVSELGVMGKAAGDGIKIRHTQPQALNDLPGVHHVVSVGLLNSFGVRPLAVGVEQVAFCRLDPPELDGVDVLCL